MIRLVRLREAYVSEALSLDEFKLERSRAVGELAEVERRLDSSRDLLEVPEVVGRIFDLLEALREGYLRATDDERRSYNQAIFAGFWFSGGRVRRYEYRRPFGDIVEINRFNSELMVDPTSQYPNTSVELAAGLIELNRGRAR